jgi:hypothetical protein
VDVVDEGLYPVHIDHHDLLARLRRRWVRDGWCVKLVDEDFRGYLCTSRTKLRQDVRCNIVVTDDVMELETVELVLEFANF